VPPVRTHGARVHVEGVGDLLCGVARQVQVEDSPLPLRQLAERLAYQFVALQLG
jgi:hypothetical protein